MSSSEEWANDRPKSEAEQEIEAAMKRLRIEVIGSVGPLVTALRPILAEGANVVRGLIKLAKEARK